MPHDYTPKDIARFQSKVKVMPSGCHEWQSTLDRKGYGVFGVGGRGGGMRFSHRVSWEITNGPIPDGILCCHTCDNPKCVNPDHLFLGTSKDNSQDASRKGRISRTHQPKGSDHKMSKLTEDDVIEIRKMRFLRQSWKSIAEHFDIHVATAWSVGTGKTWKNVDYPVSPPGQRFN